MSDLRAALEPFANIGLVRDHDPHGPDCIDAPDLAITPTDVRRARSALAGDGETVREALEELMRCSSAIVGASMDDPDAREAFDMFNNARLKARKALSALPSPMPVRGEITGEILAELLDFLKLHKAQFFQPGWTNRDRDELMAIMHKGNAVALSASPSPPIPAVEIDGEKERG